MNNSIKTLLKEYLDKKEYDSYNEILKKEIIYFYVKKIQRKDENYLYSSLVELIDDAENYLSLKDIEILNKFYNLTKTNYDPEILSEKLIDIYVKMI